MKSFLGWINIDAENKLNNEHLSNISFSKSEMFQQGSNGIATFESSDNFYFKENENCWFIITGYPDWLDQDLKNISNKSDAASALCAGYIKYNEKIVNYISGHFSIIIIHKQKPACLLATDRIGTRSIVHFKTKNTLFFSDSLDAIAALPFTSLTIDQQSIFNYMYYHIIPSPNTIYSECKKLEPATSIYIDENSFEIVKYWKPTFDYENYNFNDSKESVFQSLRNAIASQSDSEHTASFLSGGLDSSTVTALFSENNQSNPTAFSMGFSEEGYDELEYARISAGHCGATLKEYTVTPSDVMSAIPVIIQNFDEPFGNSSAAPTYICAKFAKDNGYDALLAGDGGDEIFAGNDRYAKQKLFELYFKSPNLARKTIIEPLLLNLFKTTNFLPIRKSRRYIEQAIVPLPDRLLSYNFFNITPVEEILTPLFLENIRLNGPVEQMRATYQDTSANNFLDKLLELDWKYTLADNDLRKVGNMCGAAQIKVRYPMLDDDVIRTACNIPPGEKLHGFKLRHFYKQAMRGFLSEKTLNKPKHGFGLPFGVWLKTDNQLKQLAGDSISDFKKRNIINPQYLQKLQEQHQSDHASFFGEFIWIIIILEQWLQDRKR